jgi:hypothetical protein
MRINDRRRTLNYTRVADRASSDGDFPGRNRVISSVRFLKIDLTWFLRAGRAKTKLVSKEFLARGFRTVSSRERVMGGDPCDSGRVPIVRDPRSYLLLGWSLFTPSQSHRGSPMPFNFGFCALSAKTRFDNLYALVYIVIQQ